MRFIWKLERRVFAETEQPPISPLPSAHPHEDAELIPPSAPPRRKELPDPAQRKFHRPISR